MGHRFVTVSDTINVLEITSITCLVTHKNTLTLNSMSNCSQTYISNYFTDGQSMLFLKRIPPAVSQALIELKL